MTLLALIFCLSQSSQTIEIRNAYEEAYLDEEKALTLVDDLKDLEQISPIELGYLGAVEMIMADHVRNPMKKLHYFNLGKEHLDQAISLAPNEIEVRYLRFVNQAMAPFFLGYNDNYDSDKKFILDSFDKADRDLRVRMFTFFTKSKVLTKTELDRIAHDK